MAKYVDHLPLYRQEAIYARSGIAIPRSTLAQWIGACGVALQPLVDRMRERLLTLPVLHADETPVGMLAPGTGKTHRSYLFAYLVDQRRRLVDDRKRTTNRICDTLKQYFPQVLDWFEHRDTLMFCDFLTRWPTLAQVKHARTATLVGFFHDHNVRRTHLVAERLDGIRHAIPLTADVAVIQSYRLFALALVEQLRVTLQAIARFDQEIAAVAPTLPDYSLFNALPGSGPVLTPRLQTAFGEQRERFQNAGQVQRYSGVAPVTQRSGKKSWVHWRWECSTFVRQTFVEWAAQTINKSFWAGAFYQQQRAKGSSHQVAVRALAFKWIRIVYCCWQTRTPYDESRYLMELQLRGSPLVAGLPTKAA